MESRSPEKRSNTNNNLSPNIHDIDKERNEQEENFKPMDMQRKGKTTTLKVFMNDDMKKIAEAASKKNGF